MLPDDLGGKYLDDYLRTLSQSHEVRITCAVRDADDVLLKRYNEQDWPIVDGQVDVDADADVQRTLRLTLANISETDTDTGNPSSMLNASRQVEIQHGIFVYFQDGTSGWVDVPVFYGPVSRIARDQDTVSIEAQSKEAYLLPPMRLIRSLIPNEDPTTSTTLDKDGKPVRTQEADKKISTYYAGDMIRQIARRYGETRMRVPRTNRKVPESAKMFDRATQDSGAWPLMQELAGAQQLLYTADGHLTLRTARRRSPVYVFNDGTDGEVLSVPTVDWDMTLFRNTIDLRAFQKKQGNEKDNPTLRVIARLEPQHPLSAQSLARNGQPRELVTVVDSQDVYANEREAQQAANSMLDRAAHNAQAVTFDTLPIPILEPGDLVALDVAGQPRVKFAVTKFSLPLTPASMSLGYNRRVSR